ncbi:hypothetical protein [Peloplasma aerotolerans]|uniref:DUF3137 domain-containing protein n=1 Tax=Peloplasma aerotolerans TaxID=3044389 RepID=A0AAW6UA46_9MOLU|nr:hypothetical protein [Mariniplasma sp. M4Ah]MDI6452794.1 hypothetical protein [Mariniplasma sp. M4Ah]MDR4968051.1 hypothetical protein [Acholeplasmataceae bacterium]
MKHRQINIIKVMLIISSVVFFVTLLALIFDDFLAAQLDVIGIRIAMLIVAFASFGSSTLFSLLILHHNKTVSMINDDLNRRAELFRELQFSSSNYSVIDFMDRMLIYIESTRYVDRYVRNNNFLFHMIEKGLNEQHVVEHPDDYDYFSFRIPFRVIEGKLISKITFNEIYFERDQKRFFFMTPSSEKESRAYLLYNEQTKRNNVIINLIVSKTSDFFDPKIVNAFSKIKMNLHITSLLGVVVEGMSELYFTNPEQIEGDFTNTYKINSSNFIIKGMPYIEK